MTAYSELSDAARMETPVAVFSRPLNLDHLHLVIEQAMQKLGKDQASKA
jgi:hypothetical protein